MNTATITGPTEIRFELLLPGPIERDWSFLADDGKRASWLAKGVLPSQPGQDFTLFFRHADLSAHVVATPERFATLKDGHTTEHRLLCIDKPHTLIVTWGGGIGDAPSEVVFQLAEEGDNVLLTLTHRLLADRGLMAHVAGG